LQQTLKVTGDQHMELVKLLRDENVKLEEKHNQVKSSNVVLTEEAATLKKSLDGVEKRCSTIKHTKMEEIEKLQSQLDQLQDNTGSMGNTTGIHNKENLVNMEVSDKLRGEVKRLTRELEESRSRSRRIAIHSEREVSKLQQSLDDMRILLERNEEAKAHVDQIMRDSDEATDSRIDDLKQKLTDAKAEVEENSFKHSELMKRANQAAFDATAKYHSLKGHFAVKQQDHDEYKSTMEKQLKSHHEREKWLLNEITRLKNHSDIDSITQDGEEKLKAPVNDGKLDMKLYHGIDKGEIELRLREDDESTASVFSQKNVENLRSEIRSLRKSLNSIRSEAENLRIERDKERELNQVMSAVNESIELLEDSEKISKSL